MEYEKSLEEFEVGSELECGSYWLQSGFFLAMSLFERP